jgi:MFS family permease
MHDTFPKLSRKKIFAATNIVLFLLCLMYFLTYIDRVNVSTASNVFEKELNLNKTEVGFIFSAFAYPYLIFQIVGGYLGDRFGPRKVLTICSLIWAGSTILTGLVGGFVYGYCTAFFRFGQWDHELRVRPGCDSVASRLRLHY